MRRLTSRALNARLGTAMRFATPSKPPPEDVAAIVQQLEKDPRLLEEVMERMHPESRRRLVIAGGALEWFGRDHVAKEVDSADADRDRLISPKDFDKWFEHALKKREQQQAAKAAEAVNAEAQATGPIQPEVPLRVLLLVALEAGLPFVGFGFLDNATMIVAGDAIDHSVGFYFNLSVMASAAMGNVCSGVMGMQVHGFIEKAVQKLNFDIPPLTEEQRRGRRVFLAGHAGGTIGIMLGLTLGMLPLLFIHDEDAKADQAVFTKWAHSSGFLEERELLLGLTEMGLSVSSGAVGQIVSKFGTEGKLSFEQFKELCKHLRHGAH
jgi:hypothetical protein